jgi:hypothetical protein
MIKIFKPISIFLISFVLLFQITACEEIDSVLKSNDLSNEEIVEGLKSALTVGTDTSVKILSAVDGYYKDALVKISLPQEAQIIISNISKVPGGNLLIDNAVLAINRAAEDAAVKATPIFVNAITHISITDGLSILNGKDDAATQYLKTATYDSLKLAFMPEIKASLSKKLVGNVSAESTYKALIDAYNTASLNGVLFPKVTTNSLSEHTTKKGLDGLFVKVALEEGNIRNDVAHRVNDILQKVFSKQ